MPPSPDADAGTGRLTERLFREESARLIASLTARFGTHRLQWVEDVVQEAMIRALQTWPYHGVPENPAAWLSRTAKNLALDQLRREKRWREKQDALSAEHERWLATADPDPDPDELADDRLRFLFVCFHPDLAPDFQSALALRTLCGLNAAEIAAAYFTTEAAIAKRLVRARQRIRELKLPFLVPEPHELPGRLEGVLGTLYLLFNEGYKASSGDHLVRADLCHEAIRLLRLLARHPLTATPSTHALLALMLLNAARLPSRTNPAGDLLRLHEQDRAAWDSLLIQDGIRHLALASTGDQITPYHLEAGIAACHSTAPSAAATDWPRILHLYNLLLSLAPSPVTRLNRAVAVARVHGAAAGLSAIDAMPQHPSMETHHLFHATRATLLAELGKIPDALRHFQIAGALAKLPAEKDFIARRCRECEARLEKPLDDLPGRG